MNSFNGQTWVAYSDLCGLKAMYASAPEEAVKALDKFYNTVYELQRDKNSVNYIVVSDCAIFWIDKPDCIKDLSIVLKESKELYQKMLPDYLVRTTIAYGHFKYENRIEMPCIRKELIVGAAYLDAYANNDKIATGAIAIVKLHGNTPLENISIDDDYKQLIKEHSPKKSFYEYYWSLQNESQIGSFVNKRKEIQNTIFQKLKELYSE